MKWYYGFLSLVLFACSPKRTSPLDTVLASQDTSISRVMKNLAAHEVQIIYTEITTQENGKVSFEDHTFQLNDQHYFYPASTVKLPAAVLAMELVDKDSLLTPYSKYSTSRDTLIHTISDDVRQIFAVSDNEAYNRLYELMGRDFINATLRNKGIKSTRINHRLSTANAAASERAPIQFKEDSTKIFGYFDTYIGARNASSVVKGRGFIRNDSLIHQPMDFSQKNVFPLRAQHDLMKRIFFPGNFSKKQQFHLSEESLSYLKQQMHTLPRNNGYDSTHYYDSYGKFFLFGDRKDPIPDHIKIYNKVGYAYGTLTDTAYIVDEKEGIQFLLSATILVNENGIFNDDIYEYDTIGIPFLAQLGRELYQYEKEKS